VHVCALSQIYSLARPHSSGPNKSFVTVNIAKLTATSASGLSVALQQLVLDASRYFGKQLLVAVYINTVDLTIRHIQVLNTLRAAHTSGNFGSLA
jgi:hypothetical protein